jgi:hypothetical protein
MSTVHLSKSTSSLLVNVAIDSFEQYFLGLILAPCINCNIMCAYLWNSNKFFVAE